MPAARTIGGRYLSGTAAVSPSTSTAPRGITLEEARLGSATRTQGDAAINRSPTAALKMVETHR